MNLSKLAVVTAGALSFALAITSSAQAGILFDESQTGIELFNNPDIVFPAAAPSVNGSSIDFGFGAHNEVMMLWDLLPAGNRGDLDISIAVDYTPLTGDNDPIFAIFDGTNYLALDRYDNLGGGISLRRGTATSTAVLNHTLDYVVTDLGPVEPFSYDLWIADGGAGPASVNNFVEGANSAAGPLSYQANFVDTDNALQFGIYRQHGAASTERYRINSIAVTIEEKKDVPEPTATAALFILGTIGSATLLRRKRKR